MYLTLAEVLDLPVIRAGRPRVRSGSGGLNVAVRWVHVSELREPAGTLSGGELLLSTGIPLADPTTDVERYVRAVRAAGAVGLVIEVGQNVARLPAPLVQAARAERFPLVELTRSVRFVEVTQAVHGRVLNAQFAQMRQTSHVLRTFHTLAIEGAGTSRVLDEASGLLGVPVVLEDLGNRAVAFAATGQAGDVLRDWPERSRSVRYSDTTRMDQGPEGWGTAPVGPRHAPWGRLVALQRMAHGAESGTAAAVLEQAAHALTVGRLLGAASVGTERDAHGSLLSDLLHVQALSAASLQDRVRGLGFPHEATYGAFVVAGTGTVPDDDLADALLEAARSSGVPVLAGVVRHERVALVLACRSAESLDEDVVRVLDALDPDAVAAVGGAAPATTLTELRAVLTDALLVADVAHVAGEPPSLAVRRFADLGVETLLWQLRGDARLSRFVDEQLAPVLALPARRREIMLATLGAYLDSGGSVTVLAERLGIARQSAYARLRQLSGVIGGPLDDPRKRMGLHVALTALRAGSAH